MLTDVIEVRALPNHRLQVTFENGASGVVDVSRLVTFTGIFAPLADEAEFRKVRVDADLGTVAWPNGADLAPESLYDAAVRNV